ncbi:basic proline-rich protein-like [Perognathus longimembris pacificus]|uniref:basic proline-rich protein-like n=1 Tax=Perognathus longimembris pacificus TaxID=214514 RepID=UPI0020184753|nr:basic proline-rich protein-like [Perognathus longimembris pacificus]
MSAYKKRSVTGTPRASPQPSVGTKTEGGSPRPRRAQGRQLQSFDIYFIWRFQSCVCRVPTPLGAIEYFASLAPADLGRPGRVAPGRLRLASPARARGAGGRAGLLHKRPSSAIWRGSRRERPPPPRPPRSPGSPALPSASPAQVSRLGSAVPAARRPLAVGQPPGAPDSWPGPASRLQAVLGVRRGRAGTPRGRRAAGRGLPWSPGLGSVSQPGPTPPPDPSQNTPSAGEQGQAHPSVREARERRLLCPRTRVNTRAPLPSRKGRQMLTQAARRALSRADSPDGPARAGVARNPPLEGGERPAGRSGSEESAGTEPRPNLRPGAVRSPSTTPPPPGRARPRSGSPAAPPGPRRAGVYHRGTGTRASPAPPGSAGRKNRHGLEWAASPGPAPPAAACPPPCPHPPPPPPALDPSRRGAGPRPLRPFDQEKLRQHVLRPGRRSPSPTRRAALGSECPATRWQTGGLGLQPARGQEAPTARGRMGPLSSILTPASLSSKCSSPVSGDSSL